MDKLERKISINTTRQAERIKFLFLITSSAGSICSYVYGVANAVPKEKGESSFHQDGVFIGFPKNTDRNNLVGCEGGCTDQEIRWEMPCTVSSLVMEENNSEGKERRCEKFYLP
jgi:hypothetical protein